MADTPITEDEAIPARVLPAPVTATDFYLAAVLEELRELNRTQRAAKRDQAGIGRVLIEARDLLKKLVAKKG